MNDEIAYKCQVLTDKLFARLVGKNSRTQKLFANKHEVHTQTQDLTYLI